MLDKKKFVFDIEADGLLDNISKIHCLSYFDLQDRKINTFTKYKDIKEFVNQDITLIGHNVVMYDIPAIKKILKCDVKATVVDTLPLAWVMDVKRKKYGLESYGIEFGVEKPPIEDWSNLSIEEYVYRCEEDVKINERLWDKQLHYFSNLYDEPVDFIRFIKYLTFKMECVRDQEAIGLSLDIEKAQKHFDTLSAIQKQKLKELAAAMPKVEIKKMKKIDNAVECEDGNIYQKGDLFFSAFADVPKSTIEKTTITGYKEPNPRSVPQIKKWLFSLGWVPENIQHKRNKETGEIKQIPQIKSAFEVGEVCNSVKKLFKKEPKLEVLGGLSIINHRITIFDGFLKDQKNGKIYPSMAGLTNTLRLQHKTVVNLPGVDKKYGHEIRECIKASPGKLLCGSDLSNIEDRTKRHYIYKYDPAYVETMNTPGYDAHLEIAVLAGYMTRADTDFYKWYDKEKDTNKSFSPTTEEKTRFSRLKSIRNKAKITNFSATYKIGAPALSRNSGMKMKESKKLLDIYWRLNNAILKIEDSLQIKEINGQKWLKNPVNKFWYTLRNDKDKFSTLNQGTASYVFDIFLTYLRQLGLQIPFQYHDEVAFEINPGEEDKTKGTIQEAIQRTNDKLKLNIQVGAGAEFGPDYASIH